MEIKRLRCLRKMIYAGFESILVPEDKVMQNPNESYIN